MKTIAAFLGTECNANCAYCHAGKQAEGPNGPSASFIRYLHDAGKAGSGLLLWFIGGEPTLYMDAIKTIVDECSGYDVTFMVSTNGLKLSEDEIVDFFNYHNFYVNVSFDGVRGIRGYDDVFYRPEYHRNLHRLKNMGCSMTLSRVNHNLIKATAELGRIETILGRVLPFRPHYVHATTPALAGRGLSRAQARQFVNDYIKLIKMFIHDYKYGLFNINLYPLFRLLWESVHAKYLFPETRCFNKNYIQADLKGNLHLCAYARAPVNYLGRVEDENSCYDNLAAIIESRRPQCLSCEFYRYCGSYCLASINPYTECYIQKGLINWFIDELNRQMIDFTYLPEQEYAKRTGGYHELYR